MIKREHYVSRIRPFIDSDLIKIITGIRRSGKSVILSQLEEELRLSGKRTLKLDFERRDVSSRITSDTALIAEITPLLSEDKLYVFLDEIQNVPNWNFACRSLRLENISLFITGSNARLLSREFTKELSGRYVSFRVRPFIYKELTQYAAELGKNYSVTDYLLYGGFPKILEFPDNTAMLQYLNDLDETIVLNDILNRYNINKTALFRRLANFVLISNARIFSASSIHKYLKGEGLTSSLNTIMKYLSYLEEAFVINQISQYSTKAKRALKYYTKIYNEDVALNTIRQHSGRYDITHNMENIIYNELIYRGYNLSVFTADNLEIDFLAEKNSKQYLVQVAYSIAEEATYQREFQLFNRLDNSRQKIIITNDDIDYSTSTVRHIKLQDFLLADDF